ncbi:hypothetical protein BC830DRAFT_299413 [Chytriomyces sp. MP71]|nr:hypothetical protein BC830DRAFT_299413 [Chytriomyces sp. MP71]
MIEDMIRSDRRNGGSGPPMGGGGSHYGPRGGGNMYPMEVPGDRVGLVIGKGGETIKMLQSRTGARMTVVQDGAGVRPGMKVVNIQGTDEQIEEAKKLIDEIVIGKMMVGSNAGYSGGPGFGQETEEVRVPNDKVGLVIGRGGETVKMIQQQWGVRLQIEQIPDPMTGERLIKIYGTNREAMNGAIDMVFEKAGMHRGGAGAYGGYSAADPYTAMLVITSPAGCIDYFFL